MANSWQIYDDPASKTGKTRKIWDDADVSNGGRPTEYFEDYTPPKESGGGGGGGSKTERAASSASQESYSSGADRDFWQGLIDSNGKRFDEDVRQFDAGIDVRKMEARDRLRLGLKELELREKSDANQDYRARERNVLDYMGAIGQLKLPYQELVQLSQRAVAGIVPGASGKGKDGGGGALTADQWAALAQGTTRNWEQAQIGQGSGMAG